MRSLLDPLPYPAHGIRFCVHLTCYLKVKIGSVNSTCWMNAGAAFGFSDDTEKVAKLGLVSGKDNTIDRSIQNAYIHAIRCAKNFIYIENQYFVGSSFGWDSSQEVGANNLIPMELVRKIASKIEAGERFSVYIVIPLYPEGYPSGDAVQAILRWQQKTFQMMYKEIANSLRLKKRTDLHPKDYLSVFCLGNRETILPNEYAPTSTPQDLYYKSAQENRRFMIYVHSKMMIGKLLHLRPSLRVISWIFCVEILNRRAIWQLKNTIPSPNIPHF